MQKESHREPEPIEKESNIETEIVSELQPLPYEPRGSE